MRPKTNLQRKTEGSAPSQIAMPTRRFPEISQPSRRPLVPSPPMSTPAEAPSKTLWEGGGGVNRPEC